MAGRLTESFLAFRIGRFIYAVPADEVLQIIHLPQFSQIDDAPDYIVGLVNMRGTVVPLIDIDVRFGRSHSRHYGTTDKVVVFSREGKPMGIIINEIIDIYDIPPSSIVEAPIYGSDGIANYAFIDTVAKIDEDIVMILNRDKVFDSGYKPAEGSHDVTVSREFHSQSSTVDDMTNAVFHRRALDLTNSSVRDDEGDDRMPLAIIEIGGELFGIELEVIREFINLGEYRQVPCCPQHIVGNVNLRGEILTLIDIAGVLSLSRGNFTSAVIVSIDDFIVGICIDSLVDIMYLPVTGFKELPAALGMSNEDFFEFTTLYEGRAVVVINLQSIIHKGNLVVNDVL